MENGREIETLIVPAEVIQHIQSYMGRKEAARSALLSKSWHAAWLTRPTIDLDYRDFGNPSTSTRKLESFARKTIQRYRDLSLKIQRFRLRGRSYYNFYSYYREEDNFDELAAEAMELGPSDVELELPPYTSKCPPLVVLRSESLVRLSLIGFGSVQSHLNGCCSRLKSLNLKHVRAHNNHVFNDMISRCDSLEELSLSDCWLNPKLFGLHKLKRMLLDNVNVHSLSFFIDFTSRFPCLKDLTILKAYGIVCQRMHIASSSLETINFMPNRESKKATFRVPNIRKFTYSGFGFPSLSINGASREWEFDITIDCSRLYSTTWFLNLKRLLKKCRLSRIVSLCINIDDIRGLSFKHALGAAEVEAEPLVVENLRIDAPASNLLLRLFGICRPKFITCTDVYYGWRSKNEGLDILCKELMKELITPNCGILDQYVFGQFGLKKVNMKVYEEFDRPLTSLMLEESLNASKALVEKRKIIRFELIWD